MNGYKDNKRDLLRRMSRYPMINQLQYGTANAFGKNLCVAPSRIVPMSQKDIPEPDGTAPYIYYTTPRQEVEFVRCEAKALLFEPSAYFRSPHTFLQSVLYLVEPSFYQVVHLPRMRQDVLMRWLKEKLAQCPEANLFFQRLVSSEQNPLDTDPTCNKYFPLLMDLLEKEDVSIQVIHADREGGFKGITPAKTKKKKNLMLLQLSTGSYAPYGMVRAT
jgi:hypothetical protein